jgi:hypothetical protein
MENQVEIVIQLRLDAFDEPDISAVALPKAWRKGAVGEHGTDGDDPGRHHQLLPHSPLALVLPSILKKKPV